MNILLAHTRLPATTQNCVTSQQWKNPIKSTNPRSTLHPTLSLPKPEWFATLKINNRWENGNTKHAKQGNRDRCVNSTQLAVIEMNVNATEHSKPLVLLLTRSSRSACLFFLFIICCSCSSFCMNSRLCSLSCRSTSRASSSSSCSRVWKGNQKSAHSHPTAPLPTKGPRAGHARKAAKFYLLKQNFKVVMDDYSTSLLSSVKLRFLTCCSLDLTP